MKSNFLKKSLKKYPQLACMTFFRTIPSNLHVSVPFRLSSSGDIRYGKFDHIINSFYKINCDQLLSALNEDIVDENIVEDAKMICENLKSNSSQCSLNLNGKYPLISLKYAWSIINDECQNWIIKVIGNDRAYIWQTDDNDPTFTTKKIEIADDLTWKPYFNKEIINLDWIDLPLKLDDFSLLLNIVKVIDNMPICKGISIDTFKDIIKDDLKNGFYIKNSEVIALADGTDLRAFTCTHLLSTLGTSLCFYCNNLRNAFYKKRSVSKIKVVNKTAHKHKSKDELSKDFIALNEKYRCLQKKLDKISGKIKEINDLQNDDEKELTKMFINLKKGINGINEKVNNPTCFWESCEAGTFDNILQLIQHVDEYHVSQRDQSTLPLPKNKTLASGKTAPKNFQKRPSENHVHSHTGKESDIFLKHFYKIKQRPLALPQMA
ncbi:unnamed protein product [Mytilus coruscus]|uniref:Uncharacterized protein n=1 Tax=Mytilus coruscus TaxID=42192 RepID=A0A6J8CLB0_MYTCO|nr:unnamed protein product [Mytilus coruscus]